MRNLIQTIAAAHFVADAKQVEALAHEHYTSNATMRGADGTYLKVLIVACQMTLGATTTAGRRRAHVDAKAHLAVLERAHEPFYAAVLRGITTPDIANDPTLERDEAARRAVERNRRSTFARSAKATLAAYVNAGGDMRGLDVTTVSKQALRSFVDKGRSAVELVERAVMRSQRALLRIVSEQAETDPDGARERLEGIIEMLQTALEELPGETADAQGASTTTLVQARGHPRSAVHSGPAQLHRGAQ